MAETFQRHTALPTTIERLLGTPSKQHYEQSALQPKPAISRVHLIAVVVAWTEGISSEATLDDGTGKILARSFENPSFFQNVHLGDIIRIVGKVKGFNEQVYLVPEFYKKITNKQWILVHKLLCQRAEQGNIEFSESKEETELCVEEIPVDDVDSPSPSPFDDILAIIREIDKGDGAPIELIIEKAGEDSDRRMQNLLETGEIFEIRPGRVKVL